MRNARASSGVLLEWHRCNFFIKKLHLCHLKGHICNFLITFMPFQENTRRTPEDVLAFLSIYIYIYNVLYISQLCSKIVNS
jgi:hypothetical protein